MIRLLLATWIAFGLGYQTTAVRSCFPEGTRRQVLNGSTLVEIGFLPTRQWYKQGHPTNPPSLDSVLVEVRCERKCGDPDPNDTKGQYTVYGPGWGPPMGTGDAFFLSRRALDRMAAAADSAINARSPLRYGALPVIARRAIDNGPRKGKP